MIRIFNDDSVAQARRSAVTCLIASIVVHIVKPELSMGSLGNLSFGREEPISANYLYLFLLATQVYLSVRIATLLPQHIFDEGQRYMSGVSEISEAISKAQQTIESISKTKDDSLELRKYFDDNGVAESLEKFGSAVESAAREFKENSEALLQGANLLRAELEDIRNQPKTGETFRVSLKGDASEIASKFRKELNPNQLPGTAWETFFNSTFNEGGKSGERYQFFDTARDFENGFPRQLEAWTRLPAHFEKVENQLKEIETDLEQQKNIWSGGRGKSKRLQLIFDRVIPAVLLSTGMSICLYDWFLIRSEFTLWIVLFIWALLFCALLKAFGVFEPKKISEVA